MSKRTGVVLGIVSVVVVIVGVVAVAALGGGGSDNGSVTSARDQTAPTAAAGSPGASGASGQPGGASGAGATPGAGTPHGTTASAPHGTTASTHATTPTTIHNTIKPIPGGPSHPAPPSFGVATVAPSCPGCETFPSGSVVGVCYGNPPTVGIYLTWETSNADYVQVNRGGNTYPTSDADHFTAQCREPPDRNDSVQLIAFGPGGEVSKDLFFSVDPTYRP
jgi:hypothetical protein